MEKTIALIEKWDSASINQALESINDVKQEKLLLDRYKNILKLVKGKKIVDLINLPKNIISKESLSKTRWKPTELDKQILKTLPISKIVIDFGAKKLPNWLGELNLKNIEVFRTGWQKVELPQLPSWIIKCENLEFLVLNGIEFKKKESIKEIETLKNLISLSLNINEWIGLEIDLTAFNKLEYLTLSGKETKFDDNLIFNKLTQIGEISTLKSLSINDYALDAIPTTWIKLTNLNTLEIEGSITSKFITSSKEELRREARITSEFLSPEATQAFLSIAITKDEDRTDEDFIFDFLESKDHSKIKKGLEILEQNPKLKEQAEKRYLNIIKVILNKTDVTLNDLLKLENTDHLVDLIQEFAFHDSSEYSKKFILDYKEANDCLSIVNLLGTVTQNALNIKDILSEVASMKNEEELSEYILEQSLKLKASLRKEMTRGLLSNGWFQKTLEIFNTIGDFKSNELRFNHTNLEKANQSELLPAFYFFILTHVDPYAALRIDIAQSTPPDFTPIFWLFQYDIPHTNWLDVQPTFPISPLSFERAYEFNKE